MDRKEFSRVANRASIESRVLLFAAVLAPYILYEFFGLSFDTAVIVGVIAIFGAIISEQLSIIRVCVQFLLSEKTE